MAGSESDELPGVPRPRLLLLPVPGIAATERHFPWLNVQVRSFVLDEHPEQVS
jgi:hypothetical protein